MEMSLNKLKWAAILCFVVAMVILLGGGVAMKKKLPPYPGKVVDPSGKVLFQKSDIMAGQNVYRTLVNEPICVSHPYLRETMADMLTQIR